MIALWHVGSNQGPRPPSTTRISGQPSSTITNIERSLQMNRPRALVQMATGSGKTFTAISLNYRLIRHADAKRILFLVDRANLGVQTFKEFQQFTTPDDGRKFTELYNVQHLRSNRIDDVSRLCISTIQRVYSLLSGNEELDETLAPPERSRTARERLARWQPRNAGFSSISYAYRSTDDYQQVRKLWSA